MTQTPTGVHPVSTRSDPPFFEGYAMKTIAAAVFAVSLGLSLSTAAVAEPFNSRGQDYVATVQSDDDTVRTTVTVTDSGFNNWGRDSLADAPAGSPAQEPMISLCNVAAHGWNS
jgi:hypothetical protein